jgi:hypothetical protein
MVRSTDHARSPSDRQALRLPANILSKTLVFGTRIPRRALYSSNACGRIDDSKFAWNLDHSSWGAPSFAAFGEGGTYPLGVDASFRASWADQVLGNLQRRCTGALTILMKLSNGTTGPMPGRAEHSFNLTTSRSRYRHMMETLSLGEHNLDLRSRIACLVNPIRQMPRYRSGFHDLQRAMACNGRRQPWHLRQLW